jgi:hypothetical protein
MRLAAMLILVGAAWTSEPEFGVWKMNPVLSIFAVDTQPRSFIMRLEPHAKGTVLTVDRIEPDGRATSSRTILYLDGKPRDFEDFRCRGTQSSHRTDSGGVEIVRQCANGASTKIDIRPTASPDGLVLEITEQDPDGRRSDQRLSLEKQRRQR